MADNFQVATGSQHFQDLLNAELTRVALINFWASFAEPCQQMNAVVLELAKKYPELLVIQVDAEEQEEIAASFDVESVPSFVILRGHTLLGRINGADAPALTTAVAQHIRVVPETSAKTAEKPAAGPPAEKEETEEELVQRMKGIMNQSKVVLFMKGSPDAPRCGFSRQTVEVFNEQKVEFTHFDILQDEAVRQGMKKLNDWPTFPQIIVNGELIGGLDVLRDMVENGEFKELIAA